MSQASPITALGIAVTMTQVANVSSHLTTNVTGLTTCTESGLLTLCPHIFDRLTDEQKATINSMKPADCARVAEKREATVNIRKYLFEMFEQGKVNNSAWCPVHNRDCRLWKSSSSPWHGEDSDSDEGGEPPLSFHGAGVICKDASNQGTLNGDAGKQMPLQHCWTADSRQRREDLIIVECTPFREPRSVFNYMPDSYRGHTSLLKSGDIGEVVRRDRKQLTMWNGETAPPLAHYSKHVSHRLGLCKSWQP